MAKEPILIRNATVAQSVERLIRNQQASGSSPLSSSKKIHALAAWIFAYLKGAKIHERTGVRIPEKRPCFHPYGGLLSNRADGKGLRPPSGR